ncbi:MAG: hypothetical protein AB7E52_01745 [Bdellovibrionales bacterium]
MLLIPAIVKSSQTAAKRVGLSYRRNLLTKALKDVFSVPDQDYEAPIPTQNIFKLSRVAAPLLQNIIKPPQERELYAGFLVSTIVEKPNLFSKKHFKLCSTMLKKMPTKNDVTFSDPDAGDQLNHKISYANLLWSVSWIGGVAVDYAHDNRKKNPELLDFYSQENTLRPDFIITLMVESYFTSDHLLPSAFWNAALKGVVYDRKAPDGLSLGTEALSQLSNKLAQTNLSPLEAQRKEELLNSISPDDVSVLVGTICNPEETPNMRTRIKAQNLVAQIAVARPMLGKVALTAAKKMYADMFPS